MEINPLIRSFGAYHDDIDETVGKRVKTEVSDNSSEVSEDDKLQKMARAIKTVMEVSFYYITIITIITIIKFQEHEKAL